MKPDVVLDNNLKEGIVEFDFSLVRGNTESQVKL